jgi:hypothetical protein
MAAQEQACVNLTKGRRQIDKDNFLKGSELKRDDEKRERTVIGRDGQED